MKNKLLEHKATRGGKHEIKMFISDKYIDIIAYTDGKECWRSYRHTTRDYAYAAWARYINAARCDDGINYNKNMMNR